MQEFSTVSASSYDPAALAAKLTEKSAEGWTVVSIVPTGGDVTAFLSRGAGSAAAETAAEPIVESMPEVAAAEPTVESMPEVAVIEADVVEAVESVPETAAVEIESVVESAPAVEFTPEPVAVQPTLPVVIVPEAVTPSAVVESPAEPAGWAIAPEPAATPMAPIVEAAPAVEPTPSYEPTQTYQPAQTYEPAAAATYQPAPAQAAPAVPAGWYADPAGRFELRYWDGSAWTEHVSRAGQQFTDPPVA